MKFLKPHTAILLMIVGIFFTFFGARFIFQVFGAMVGVTASVLVFLQTYNLFVQTQHFDLIKQVGLMVVSLIVGVYLGKGFYIFSKEWSIPLICTLTGFVLSLVVGDYIELTSPTIQFLFSILFGVVFKELAQCYQGRVKRYGTAFIGSFFLMKSIGTFFGGYPDELTDAKEQNPLIWAYFLGFVFTTILGAKV